MKRISNSVRTCLVTTLVLGLSLGGDAAKAIVIQKNEGDGYIEYLGVTGALQGRNAPYRLLVPSCWNGTLLVYARGTGSLVRVNADGRPLDSSGNLLSDGAFPLLGLTPLANGLPEITAVGLLPSPDDRTVSGTLSSFESQLLGLCFALAATDYKPDERFIATGRLGWAVEDGVTDLPALTIEAKAILFVTAGAPRRTILWGRSQGSLVALSAIERLPGRLRLFDGTITGCTVGAGASRSWDSAIDAAVAYDVVFANQGGWPWGIDRITPPPGETDLSFLQHVAPDVSRKLADPSNFARFEFIRLVTGLPSEGFYPVPIYRQFNWLFAGLQFATEVRADAERKAGGPVGQNLDHFYRLSKANRAYLKALDPLVTKAVVDAWLQAMNNRRTVAGSEMGKTYTARFADFTGRIRTPVLTMHTTTDGLVLPSQETEYRRTLEAAGKAADLRQVYVQANGHCSFTPREWLAALTAMGRRLDDGRWPLDAELGQIFISDPPGSRFVPFAPGPFPQPPQL